MLKVKTVLTQKKYSTRRFLVFNRKVNDHRKNVCVSSLINVVFHIKKSTFVNQFLWCILHLYHFCYLQLHKRGQGCREKLDRWFKQQQHVSVIGGGLFHASATGLMSFTQAQISWPDGRVIRRKTSNTLSGSI